MREEVSQILLSAECSDLVTLGGDLERGMEQ